MTSASKKTKGLGRGLSSLMGDEETATTIAKNPIVSEQENQKQEADELINQIKTINKKSDKSVDSENTTNKEKISPQTLPTAALSPTPLQPRKHFNPTQISELANSIKSKGLLQPILVRKSSKAGEYEIVAGERRWRAAQKAKLHDVPVVVKQLNNQEVLQIAIIENVQREDLTPVEEARAYARLIDDFSNTQEDIAKFVSKSRSHVANLLRLLSLPQDVIELLESGKLSMGHARTLVGKVNASELAKQIIKEKMTVREAEVLTSDKKAAPSSVTKDKVDKDTDTKALEQDLSDILGLKVDIAFHGKSGGKLSVKYKTLEQLTDICDRLKKEPS